MLRTFVSICVLFGSLLVVTRAMQKSLAEEPAVDRNGAAVALLPPANAATEEAAASVEADRAAARAGADESETRHVATEPAPTAGQPPVPVLAELPPRPPTSRTILTATDHHYPNPVRRAAVPTGETETAETLAPVIPARQATETETAPEELDATADPPSDAAAAVREKVQNCLAHYHQLYENSAERSPWGLMHTAIAFGVDTEILAGDRKVNALGWLCWNGAGRGQRLFSAVDGQIDAPLGPGYQGHHGQFLAILAQCRVPSDYGMKIDGREFTVRDLIEYEKQTCEPQSELTFKLIGLSHYLKSDETWQSASGEEWSIPRLIEEELAQPVVGAACGGTHRMMGFSYAVHKRREREEPFEGQWKRAKKYVESFVEYTYKLQNSEGSFSTNWFEGRGDWGDIDRRLQTTGHILEWLVYTLPADELGDPRVVKSVEYLTDLLLENRTHDWEIGPRGHALHALALYDEKAFGRRPGQREFELAEQALPEDRSAALPASRGETEPYERPLRRRRLFRR